MRVFIVLEHDPESSTVLSVHSDMMDAKNEVTRLRSMLHWSEGTIKYNFEEWDVQ